MIALILALGFVRHGVSAQGLPELPELKDPQAPLLSPENMIPDKPSAEEALPSLGQDQNAKQRKQAELDRLFKDLKHTANVDDAAKIARQIQGLWEQSGSDTIDLLMQWSEEAVVKEKYAVALDLLDNVVVLEPDYGEGWFRRAVVHLQQNDVKLAMLDLNEALKLEPRNYNALAMLGSIMDMTDRKDLALKAYFDALSYYPQMQRVQKLIDQILQDQTDQAT